MLVTVVLGSQYYYLGAHGSFDQPLAQTSHCDVVGLIHEVMSQMNIFLFFFAFQKMCLTVFCFPKVYFIGITIYQLDWKKVKEKSTYYI